MPKGRIHIDPPTFADEALGRGARLAAGVSAECPVLLYAAPLRLASVVLGAYQHAPHALRVEALDALALPVVRRRTGGVALWGGEGVLYVALGLLDASTLMRCPPGRILNRNLRGALAGLRSLGVPTHYFGRDFLSFGTEPGVYEAWAEAADGKVLLEMFVAVDTSFALPPELSGASPDAEAPFHGKTPTTLRAASKVPHEPQEVARAISSGYSTAFDVQFVPVPPTEVELRDSLTLQPRVDLSDTAGLCWSSPHSEAIGSVYAGIALHPSGTIERVCLGGDFFQQQSCPERLTVLLQGALPEPAVVGAALDAVYGASPGRLEGVRSLRSFEAAILEAASRARAAAISV